VTVAWDYLGGDGSTFRPICLATCSSTLGSILAKVPTAPEMAQVGDLLARCHEPGAGAAELGIVARKLEAEGCWLGVDAMATPNGGRHFIFVGAFLSAASKASVSSIKISAARASWTFRQVSSTSELVMPW